MDGIDFQLHPMAFVSSPWKSLQETPKYGRGEGVVSRITFLPEYEDCLDRITLNKYVHVITWFHQADRGVKKVHPRQNQSIPLHGVFATRSPSRPNPIGFTLVEIVNHDGLILDVKGLDALDGTPVLDIKPFVQDIDSLPWENE